MKTEHLSIVSTSIKIYRIATSLWLEKSANGSPYSEIREAVHILYFKVYLPTRRQTVK